MTARAMRVAFPLSLKVLLWLLLHLVLLAGAGLALLFAQKAAGWDSLIRGPVGQAYQELSIALMDDYAAAPPADRAAVLEKLGRRHGAEFFVFSPQLPGVPEPREVLPGAVHRRVVERPPSRPPPTKGGPGGEFGGRPPPEYAGKRPPPGGPGREGGPPPKGERGPPADGFRQVEEARGRFLIHSDEPDAYWLGARALIPFAAGPRPDPAVVVAKVGSRWAVLRLLGLEPWLLGAAGIVAFSILFWLPPVIGITRHVRRLTAATEEIADGRFETRVATARRDELGRLGESVNVMAGRLDALVNGQKKFLGDVAHELGSPLGRLQVAIEILETRADAALQPQIADVREEVQQMSALVNELLAFTKAGLLARGAELAAVAIAPLVHQVAQREGAGVAVSVPEALTARADAPLLARALGNLVRNAVRHGGGAATVSVTARREDTTIIVTVEDDGPGVPAEALARLGEPFYRPDVARTREAGGVGLGLSIVRSAVAACGGTVAFSNRTPRGFRAEVRLAAA